MALFMSFIKPVAASKITELQDLQSKENIISFTKSQYTKYVLESTGDYDIVMYYTLSTRCEHCEDTYSELYQVANSYISAGKHTPTDKSEKPVFFAKLEFNKMNEDLFRLSEFTSVPILTLATDELSKFYLAQGFAKYDKHFEWRMNPQDFVDAGKILEHINKLTNHSVELRYTLNRVLLGNGLILGLVAIVFFFKDHLAALLRIRIIWVIGTAIIFIMCIGGTAFNMIHRVPTFKYGHDQSGNMVVEEYFQRNQRSQYQGEGYMASMLMILIGGTMVGFVYMSKMQDSLKKEAICMTLIVVIFFLITLLNLAFQLKSPHYNPSFWPPEHYQTGPLMFDQGTVINDL